jgi:hypothetical protein
MKEGLPTELDGVTIACMELDALIAFAPTLNRVASPWSDFDGDDSGAHRVTELLSALNIEHVTPGALFDLLRRDPSVDDFDTVALAAFIAAAGTETLRSLITMCLASASASPTLAQVLNWVTPVPLVPYGDQDEIVLIHVQPSTGHTSPFGFGRHYCWGAPIAHAVGNALLSQAPLLARRTLEIGAWENRGLTRVPIAVGPPIRLCDIRLRAHPTGLPRLWLTVVVL